MKKFDTVIMNPPYGKMHLPILAKLTEEVVDRQGGKIISLQPLRWLEDSFWKWKKNKPDAQKHRKSFEGKLEVVKEIPALEAEDYFDASFTMNLAIFKVSRKSDFNYEKYLIDESHPMFKKARENSIKQHMKVYEEEDYFVPLNTHTFFNKSLSLDDGFKYGVLNTRHGYIIKGRTKDGTFWKESFSKWLSKNYKIVGVAFETEKEMLDFYKYITSDTMKKWLKIVIKDAHIYYQFIPYIFDGYETIKT